MGEGTRRPPRARLGGAITFRGVAYASAAALEAALAEAVREAGRRDAAVAPAPVPADAVDTRSGRAA